MNDVSKCDVTIFRVKFGKERAGVNKVIEN